MTGVQTCALPISQALQRYHEDPSFEECCGVLPQRAKGAYALTRSQQGQVDDLEEIEAITGLQPVFKKMGKRHYPIPREDMTLIRKFLRTRNAGRMRRPKIV